uniref:Uncharacterized protein n=1 Tax=Schistocephalus solidus TaxID=70667 RepID=A0A0X3P317_SCHSO
MGIVTSSAWAKSQRCMWGGEVNWLFNRLKIRKMSLKQFKGHLAVASPGFWLSEILTNEPRPESGRHSSSLLSHGWSAASGVISQFIRRSRFTRNCIRFGKQPQKFPALVVDLSVSVRDAWCSSMVCA